jgi:hypothetical protein
LIHEHSSLEPNDLFWQGLASALTIALIGGSAFHTMMNAFFHPHTSCQMLLHFFIVAVGFVSVKQRQGFLLATLMHAPSRREELWCASNFIIDHSLPAASPHAK